MTNNNNNSWTKDLRAAILLWGAKDRSQRPGRSQTVVGGQQDPQPWPGRGQCCCPSSSYSPTPSPPPPHATCFSLGTPQDSIVPRAGGGSPCRVGGMWGSPDLLLIPPAFPPLRSELDSRHRYSHGGGATSSSAPTDTTHTPRTDRHTDLPHVPPGRVKASTSGRGWGGYFLATLL